MLAAPSGWGYVTGWNLLDEPEDMPDIVGIEKMPSTQVMLAFIDMLSDRPKLLKIVTGSMMMKKYPTATRHQCYESIDYAKSGTRPMTKGRQPGYKRSARED